MPLLYDTPDAWLSAPEKRLSVFGMSGLGKTRLASLMREAGEWFHYSIDYRIGTAYMGEHITDNLKRQAMQVPFLADLLRSDSIYIGSNITFGNLAPLSTFLGKPGDTARAACPSRNTCAGRTCTGGPRSTRCSTRPPSSLGRATSTAIHT
jgi:hypothetical protein